LKLIDTLSRQLYGQPKFTQAHPVGTTFTLTFKP